MKRYNSLIPIFWSDKDGSKTVKLAFVGFYRLIGLCSLLLVLPTFSFAAQSSFYVSPNGKNTNSGTLSSPWKTLSFAVSKLSAGNTLYVRGGIYAETVWIGNSGTTTQPIVITAYSGEYPVIDGSGLIVKNWNSLIEINGAYVQISGFELRNMNLNGAVAGGFGLNMQGVGDTASNMLVHDIWSQPILLQNDNEVLRNSTVYRGALMNCRLSTATACGVRTNKYNQNLGWPGCVGIVKSYNSGLINKNSTIKGVTVHDCWGEGISTFNSTGAIIEDNVSYNNFSENLYVNNAVHALVQRNIVYNAPDSYLGSYAPVAGFALADEQNNSLPTLASNLGEYNTVINNFILNSSVSLYGWTEVVGTGLNNVIFANNTIINSNFSTGFGGTDIITNNNTSIVNNIISGGKVFVPSALGLTFSSNLWLTTPPATAQGTQIVIGDPKLAATGQTGAGQLSAGYFKLLSSSKAIGKGIPLSQVTTNFFGVPVTNPPNIGGD